ncbi:hypothetical protein QFZ77_004597 [Paenibacillus sp. V4I3]|uniref:hypothetical protein n=1 Tax=Paenibacillus sp. V4I3 TaxID=3042305 RepID=UPI002783E8D2|nr:hypothetical protein [Paenibacillus sp. V4I3]MDQ0875938.1 hypothetical protein [Paenibacillus sp. V4I3]
MESADSGPPAEGTESLGAEPSIISYCVQPLEKYTTEAISDRIPFPLLDWNGSKHGFDDAIQMLKRGSIDTLYFDILANNIFEAPYSNPSIPLQELRKHEIGEFLPICLFAYAYVFWKHTILQTAHFHKVIRGDEANTRKYLGLKLATQLIEEIIINSINKLIEYLNHFEVNKKRN